MNDPSSPDADPRSQDSTSDPALEADRAISPVAGLGRGRRRGRWMTIAALGVGCAAFYLASAKNDRPKPPPAPKEPARQVVFYQRAAETDRPTLATPGADAPALLAGVSEPTAASRIDAAAGAGPDRQNVGGPSPPAAALVRETRASPLLVYAQEGTASSALAEPLSRVPDGGMSQAPSELDQLRQSSTLGRSRARPIGDRNFLILAGATIPCVLLTALDSATPGYVTCMVPTDIYSDNGTVILLERGTKVLGEYRSSLRQGQNRLFVLWTRAVTPSGVAVSLSSPAADTLGRAGFDGELDSHFWDRFGGAILLSIIDGGYAVRGADHSAQIVRAPSDAASVAMQNSVNISPSLRKAQGAQISILAAQDFDFSGVYGLRRR